MLYSEHHLAKRPFSESCNAKVVILSVIMLSGKMLNVIMPSVILLSVAAPFVWRLVTEVETIENV